MTTAEALRRGLLGLAGLGVVGTLIELATLRHWKSVAELAPWALLVMGGALVALVTLRPTRAVVLWARWVGLALAAGGACGLIVHVVANMSTAPLDATIGPSWASLGVWRQIWLASTGEVGPAPPLSAASIAPTGLAMALATYHHGSLDGVSRRVIPTRASPRR